MAIGRAYPQDNKIVDSDLFLGTKSSNLATVNYTAQSLADYLNNQGKISIGGQMTFKFVTVNPVVGTISFPDGGGDNTDFSLVTNLIVSIIDMSSQDVVNFIDYIVGSEILLAEQNQVSIFGNYKIISYNITSNPNLYNLTLEYIGGYGSLHKDIYYDLGFFRNSESIGTIPNLEQVLAEGNSAFNDIYIDRIRFRNPLTPTSYTSISGDKNRINFYSSTGDQYGYFGPNAVLINNGLWAGSLKTTTLTNSRIYTFPDQSGTVALTTDIPTVPTLTSQLTNDGADGINPFITAADIPPSASTLNDVLTNGNTSLLDANIGGLGLYDLEGSAYATLTAFDHGFIFKDYIGEASIAFEQGNLNIYKTNSISGSLSTNLLTVSRGYYLPDAAGTIALTSDIPSLTGYALESWVTSNFYPLTGNPSGFITSSALTPYLLSTTAASTYYPIPTGTISQYIRGDGTFATFPGLTGYVPYTGATANVNLGIYDITASHLIKNGGVSTQFLKADGSVDNNVYLTSADLPSTLDLFATTTADLIIPGYTVLVRNILDPRYNTVAVDVPTGAITTTNQLLSSLITDTNVISGNPGVFNFTTIGNIQRIGGTGQADFFFRIYKRDSLGVETFITQSDNTLPVLNSGYAEFSAVALWNDGTFLSTDRIVLKYYANRIPTGSNPSYQFQFGGLTPVRSQAAVPVAVLPNIYLSNLVDVEDIAPLPNEVLYWNETANLWEHSLVINLLSPASSSVNGYLSSTDWIAFNGKQNAITLGTTAQYFRGDLSLATFPTIPTVGTWGALNYPTWTAGAPFVKMTAVGTFALDTTTYQTALTLTTTGTSGAATLIGNTLNIPQYGGGGGSTPVKLTSQTLTAASWTLIGGYYTYTFSNVNVTTSCDVSVTPQNTSYLTAYNAQVLPYVGVAVGVATFYSQFPPAANMTVDIVITQTV